MVERVVLKEIRDNLWKFKVLAMKWFQKILQSKIKNLTTCELKQSNIY